MAVAAKSQGMSSPQFKAAELHMIKLSSLPPILIVAYIAVSGKSKSAMGGLHGLLIVGSMTTETFRGGAGIAGYVTGVALQLRLHVSAFQIHCRMLKGRLSPTGALRLMATLAIRAESCLDMIGIFGKPEVIGMASVTVHGRSGEFPDLLVHMTGFAIGDGVSAYQREAALAVQGKHLLLILPVVG